ncbi:MAG: hypothetical protein WDN47_00440 [Candidatus Doudnabacteria bacterium]
MANRYIALIIVLIALAIGGVFIGVVYWINFPVKAPATGQTSTTTTSASAVNPAPSLPQAVPASTPEDLLKVMRTYAKISVPEIASQTDATAKDIPSPIATLLGSQTNLKVTAVNYANKSSGLIIEFAEPKNVQDTFTIFRHPSSDWNVLSGTNAPMAALVDLDNANYSVVIELSQVADTQTAVKTWVIKK